MALQATVIIEPDGEQTDFDYPFQWQRVETVKGWQDGEFYDLEYLGSNQFRWDPAPPAVEEGVTVITRVTDLNELYNLIPNRGYVLPEKVNENDLQSLFAIQEFSDFVELGVFDSVEDYVRRAEEAAIAAEASASGAADSETAAGQSASDAEAAQTDIDLTYAGQRTDFPVWSREGAFMHYIGDTNGGRTPTGVYVYSSGYVENNGWQPAVVPIDSGVIQYKHTFPNANDVITLAYSPLAVEVAIWGIAQSPGTDYTLEGNQITLDQTWGTGTEVNLTLYISTGFKANVELIDFLPADTIYAIDDAEIGDAYVCTEDGTIVGENDDWVVGDIVVWSSEGAWGNAGQIVGPEGPQGPTGDTGPQGNDGPAGPQGDEGPQGEKGDPGTGISPVARLDCADIIAESPEAGDLYIANDTDPTSVFPFPVEILDGILWTEGGSWENIGPIQGPDGLPGEDGEDGTDGAPGTEGPEGPRGPAGPPSAFLYESYDSLALGYDDPLAVATSSDPNGGVMFIRQGIVQTPGDDYDFDGSFVSNYEPVQYAGELMVLVTQETVNGD